MAPEVYSGAKYGPSVDFYALGLVIYEMLSNGQHPFKNKPQIMINKMQKDGITMEPHFSDTARDLIAGLTHPDPTKRFGCNFSR